MKIVCTSDTHFKHDRVSFPDGDVLIMAGDITLYGEITELTEINKWIDESRYNHVVIIAGNHDRCLITNDGKQELKSNKIHYLEDSGVMIDGVKFYGSPWTRPLFSYGWAFGMSEDKLDVIWSRVPLDTDVLITHSPPRGIRDVNVDGYSCGSFSLLDRVQSAIRPKLHVFGHIHEGYGTLVTDDTLFINASLCGVDMITLNKPIVVDI